MEICDSHVPSLLFYCFILSTTPFVFSTLHFSHHPHPHIGNASDQHALLAFMSPLTPEYDPLPTTWKPNVSFCNWTGIICSRRRQRVVSLNVSSMGLQEYGLGGHVTTKGDVYSYGIMLLEMLTGKKPTDNMFVEGMYLQKWVASCFPNRLGEVLDNNLLRRTSTSTEEDKDLYCLNQIISVGLLCTKESPEERPTMMDIVGKLQSFRNTFLGVVGNPNFQSNITDLLGCASTTDVNSIDESQSSSTF